ncbi:MAG TPA: hypothetical protein DDW98_04580, partial [Gammaproteobacteria bacterium]|nr:hypothetical protein [Gammaproteobacteria bacterium]
MGHDTLPWHLPPGWPLILGALVLAGCPRRLRAWLLPIPALLALMHLDQFNSGTFGQVSLLGKTLVTARLDALSAPFAWLFGFAALAGSIYLRSSPRRLE